MTNIPSDTPRNNIPPRTLLVIDGVEHIHRGYVVGKHDIVDADTGAPFVMPRADGTTGFIDDDQLSELIDSGRLQFRPMSRTDRAAVLAAVGRRTIEDAMKIDPFAAVRLFVCVTLDDEGCPLGVKATDIALAKHGEELVRRFGLVPKASTVIKWRRERGKANRRHARDMVSLRGRTRRRTSIPEAVEETMQKHALLKNATAASIRGAYALFDAEIQRINRGEHPTHPAPEEPYTVPAKRTFRRRCDALEQSRTVKAGKGGNAVEQGWEGGGRSLTADYAMHRVIIDHTRLDVHAVSDDLRMVLGRPWLSVAIDVFTRTIVGWVLTFMDPSAWTVAELLRRIALPKRPPSAMLARYPILRDLRGRPTEIVLDNAAEFTSTNLEAAARAAGLAIRWCPIGKPRYRAVGERVFATINRWVSEEMPGRVLPPEETGRLGYDPTDTACAMMDEIEATLNQVVAEYNTEPHHGLGGRQPALVFQCEAKRRGIDVWLDFDGFRLDVLPIIDGAQLSPSGLKAFGTLRFGGKREVLDLLDDLVPVEGRRQRRDQATATVSYRYDPLDISKIHVWNRVRKTYVTLTCSDETYADGMPLAFHEQLREQARGEGAAFNTEAERDAFRAIRIAAIKAISPEAGARARKAVAQLYETSRVRQITGNIVDLRIDVAEPASVGEFIAHDRAALTAFDVEVRSPRPFRTPRRASDLDRRRDVRDAGGALAPEDGKEDGVPAMAPRRRRGGGAEAAK